MNIDQPDHGIALPMLSDEAAVEILNFLEATFQIFETRYAHQIHRYYDSISKNNIVQYTPSATTDDDLPF